MLSPIVGTEGMVIGPVVLERLLGVGGMGCVWAGLHLELEASVAIKIIHPLCARMQPSLGARLRRESLALAKLSNPHAVRVLGHGVCGDVPYCVMERLRGTSLAERLQHGCLDLRTTSLLVTQVASVLAEADAHGIIHRDIKPCNLFLIDSPNELFVKVLDFGIARLSTGTGTLTAGLSQPIGTRSYMGPEQFLASHTIDARADLWSLAAVAFRALTGMPIFDSERHPHVAAALIAGEIAKPSACAPDLPPALDAWFDIAFAKNIEDRFQTAVELEAAFATVVADIEARRPSAARAQPEPDAAARMPPSFGALPLADVNATTVVMPKRRRHHGWHVGIGALLGVAAGATLFALTAVSATAGDPSPQPLQSSVSAVLPPRVDPPPERPAICPVFEPDTGAVARHVDLREVRIAPAPPPVKVRHPRRGADAKRRSDADRDDPYASRI